MKNLESITDAEFVEIPELGIEVTKEVLYKGKTYNQIRKLIPKNYRLLSLCRKEDNVNEVVWLANSKYAKTLKMDDSSLNDDFFIEPPFNLNRKNGYVAGLNAYCVRAGMGCYGDPLPLGSALGVRLAREKSRCKK